jgi:hypothetical protein
MGQILHGSATTTHNGSGLDAGSIVDCPVYDQTKPAARHDWSRVCDCIETVLTHLTQGKKGGLRCLQVPRNGLIRPRVTTSSNLKGLDGPLYNREEPISTKFADNTPKPDVVAGFYSIQS